jgi:hypothetical protein
MVKFNKAVMVRCRQTSYTEEDFDAAWYTEEDIRRFKGERKEIKKMVKRFASIAVFERTMGDLHSSHGLEKNINRSHAAQRRKIIESCWNAVLTTQEDQQENDETPNPEEIAKQYMIFSESSQKEAIARALLYMAQNSQADPQPISTNQHQQIRVMEPSKLVVLPTNKKDTEAETMTKSPFSVFLSIVSSKIAKERI